MTSLANSFTLLVTVPMMLMIPAIVEPTDLIAPTKAVSKIGTKYVLIKDHKSRNAASLFLKASTIGSMAALLASWNLGIKTLTT